MLHKCEFVFVYLLAEGLEMNYAEKQNIIIRKKKKKNRNLTVQNKK